MPPEVTVAVPSHERPLRLRWLLNALEEQTLEPARFEVVVVHDSGDDTERLIVTHPLARSGRLRHVRLPAGTGSASRQRNVAWRAATAPLVAFTDDDCRPAPGWLAALVTAARASPGALVQGRTLPDPYEAGPLRATPNVRTLHVDPPTPHVPTCNVLYPRAVLDRVGGFSEQPDLSAGEDTDLAQRAIEAGAGHVAAAGAVVYHAVTAVSLRGRIRAADRWADLAYVPKRHPHLRGLLVGGIFWRRSHALLALALGGAAVGAAGAAAGGAAAGRRRGAAAGRGRRALGGAVAVAAAAPYAVHQRRLDGRALRGWARFAFYGPGRVLVDLAEMRALARGSVRHRTVML